jgi:uncharacterized OsmC-like protein
VNDAVSIKTALEQTIDVLEHDPGKARRTFRVEARLEEGLRVTTTEGRWEVTMDMAEAMGGKGSAPNPGVFARAALLGCVVVGVRLQAALDDVVLDDLDMSLESDGDGRGILGLGDVAPGFEAFRLNIRITSSTDETKVREMVDRALARSPWWNVVSKPQDIHAEVSVIAPE